MKRARMIMEIQTQEREMVDTRRCEIDYDFSWAKEQGKKTAFFHRWGDTVEFVRDKPMQITVAIVELDDGRIEMVPPGKLEFTDK